LEKTSPRGGKTKGGGKKDGFLRGTQEGFGVRNGSRLKERELRPTTEDSQAGEESGGDEEEFFKTWVFVDRVFGKRGGGWIRTGAGFAVAIGKVMTTKRSVKKNLKRATVKVAGGRMKKKRNKYVKDQIRDEAERSKGGAGRKRPKERRGREGALLISDGGRKDNRTKMANRRSESSEEKFEVRRAAAWVKN